MDNKPVQLDLSQKLNYEEILTNPILDIAARFWDNERYEGFKTLYKAMRLTDDLVDNYKSRGNIPEDEKQRIIEIINTEVEAINNGTHSNPIQKDLSESLEKFKITKQPWEKFFKAMIYDITHNGFKNLNDFFEYTEGAAVAPASIFLHLCGVTKKNGEYTAPEFDTEKAARPLALFCYLVHIIRDFQKDQENNLNYFADDLIRKNELDLTLLKKIASGGEISFGFRNLMKEYYLLHC